MAASAARKNAGVLALFDVDGTLTAPRKEVTPEMLEFMKRLRENVTVGVVGGSDLVKISEQLGKSVITDYDYVFSENGLVAHKDGKLIGTQSLKTYLGDDQLKEFINFTLHYIADLDIPIKRGTFIEFRSGMINVSPIGRNCSQEERDDFEKYDKGGNDHEIFESDRTVGHTGEAERTSLKRDWTFYSQVYSHPLSQPLARCCPASRSEQCSSVLK